MTHLFINFFLLARRSLRSIFYRPIVFQQAYRALHDQSDGQGADSNPAYDFVRRHLGPNEKQTNEMLRTLGVKSMDELISKTVPASIQFKGTMEIPEALCRSKIEKRQNLLICFFLLYSSRTSSFEGNRKYCQSESSLAFVYWSWL